MFKQIPLPPGPTNRLSNSRQIALRPVEFYRELFAQHGDTVYLPTFNGRVVATRSPELARQIFSQQSETYKAFAKQVLVPLVGPRSLLSIDGEVHKQDRKLIMPSFHGKRMKVYGEIIQQTTLERLKHWPKDQVMPIQELATQVSLQVILRAVFGVVPEADVLAQWQHAIVEAFRKLNPAFLFFRPLQIGFLGLSPWDRFQQSVARLHGMILDEIRDRRGKTAEREDILSMLMEAQYDDDTRMSDAVLCDQLMTLLVAGHETTATSLAWAMYFLHKHPQTKQTLMASLETSDDPVAISRQPYLKAVCQETLRCRPVVADVLRDLNQPMQLGDYLLNEHMSVAVSISGLHEHPDLYAKPLSFYPEHFMTRQYKPWEYAPFGGGNRRCVGAAFASFEMAIVLDTWLKHAQFELRQEHVPMIRNGLVMGPKHGVRMIRR